MFSKMTQEIWRDRGKLKEENDDYLNNFKRSYKISVKDEYEAREEIKSKDGNIEIDKERPEDVG